ncbi:MAG: substrate-binding domain-containing protein [Pirellulales bacterium]|nr:substrate-binding domain-containing protein [Pirellulales bacterium]
MRRPLGSILGSASLAWLLALGACLTGCSNSAGTPGAAAAAGGSRYIILMNNESPFWDAVRVGMNEEAKRLGVDAVLEPNSTGPAGQIEKLRQYGTQSDIAGVAVCAADAANASLVDEMRKLAERGIPIITLDSDVDRGKFRDARFAFIGTDNLKGGKTLGVAAKNLVPDGGAYVQFVGRIGAQNAIERMDGFKEGAGEKLVERDRMGDETDRTRARENVRNAIRNHPDANVLVGIWSYNAPAIAEIVKAEDKQDKITVVAFDAEQQAINYLEQGLIQVLVVQNPYEMGAQSVRLLKSLKEKDDATVKEMFPNHGQPEGDLYDTGLKVVVPDGSPLKAEMFDSNVQFMPVAEFRAWLAKYNLNAS